MRTRPPPASPPAVSFRDINFAYPLRTDMPVLGPGFELEIGEGEVLALVHLSSCQPVKLSLGVADPSSKRGRSPAAHFKGDLHAAEICCRMLLTALFSSQEVLLKGSAIINEAFPSQRIRHRQRGISTYRNGELWAEHTSTGAPWDPFSKTRRIAAVPAGAQGYNWCLTKREHRKAVTKN